MQRTRQKLPAVLAWNGDDKFVIGMFEVPVAAPGAHLDPAVPLEQTNDFAHLERHLSHRRINDNAGKGRITALA